MANDLQTKVDEILSFDPFPSTSDGEVGSSTPTAEKSGQQAGGEQQPQGGQQQGQQPSKEQKPAPTGQQPQQPAQQQPGSTQPVAQPAMTPSVDQLQGRVEATQRLVETLLAQGQSQPASQQTTTPKEPKYNFEIPPQIAQAIRSEDPSESAAGMKVLINGLANRIYQDVASHIAEQMTSVPQVVQQIIQHQNSQDEIRRDFFSSYPHLSKPELQPLIAQTAQTLTMQWQASGRQLGWTPEFKQTLHDTVIGILNSVNPQGQQQPQGQQPAQQPQQRQTFQAGGAPARQNGASSAPTEADAMIGVLDSIGIKV